ncbi:hypothetical protein C3432_01830 [Citrobacter amalonaticus]|uniref:Translocator protein BipB-like C-terminal domain-containing protein n=1 Tax=Citrobacter amalonaticus TaxID=35703 RepID=A0A2S4S2H9_CITAM|nr:type III secretion system translocon subunit SctE [Citrobacter amalonaticus]POT59486.1 hypothetical protein C3432_01830 [Citrobacter amalonaticus]POT77616.1 hypothetical protein C3436_09500 [Citrobacter amalonaticus]POU68068.1 hypothetical protein C3430_03035 [Citrobacter amalonaticus]POV07672.1 hypothetical protein C3424_03045 [Citrobacter amalonaticus]
MNGITNNPLPRSAYSNNIDQQDISAAAKTEAVKLSSDQMDAARKIVENKVITQFDKSQNSSDTLKPSLRAPLRTSSATTPALTSSAQNTVSGGLETEKKGSLETYNELMANLIVLLGEQSIDELQARAEMYTKYSKENATASNEVLNHIESEEQAYTESKIAQTEAMKDVNAAESRIAELSQEIRSLQQSRAEIEKQLNDPRTSAEDAAKLKSQLNSVNSQISQKQSSLSVQQANLKVAQDKLGVATTDLMQKSAQLQLSLNYLDSLNKNAAAVNASLNTSLKTAAGTPALLMAQLIAIIGESTEETMELNLKFSQKVQAAQQEKLANDAEEVEKQQEKSKRMQETMGCIGKIIGAIVTIVATVAAVFTGGASLALAAIGIALMVADTVYQKVTGNESFIAAALKPIVEHVLMPIIQAITNAVSQVLEKLGIKNDIAEIIATVIAIVVLIVAAVAAAVVAKKLPIDKLMNVIGAMLKKVINTVISALAKAAKPIISGVKNVADDIGAELSKVMKSVSNALNQLVGNQAKSKLNVMKEFFSDEANIKTLGNKFNLSEDILRLVDVSVDSSGNIAAGTLEKRVSEMMADITRMLSASASMKLFTDSVTDSYTRSIENMNMLMTTAADMAGEEQQVGRFIFSHTRA